MRLRVEESGSFNGLEKWLKRVAKGEKSQVESLAKAVVDALKSATPSDSGKTASLWNYKISKSSQGWVIEIVNTNINKSVNIAVILHYGHGTGTGGYVPGRYYITKAIDSSYQSKIDEVLRSMIK